MVWALSSAIDKKSEKNSKKKSLIFILLKRSNAVVPDFLLIPLLPTRNPLSKFNFKSFQ